MAADDQSHDLTLEEVAPCHGIKSLWRKRCQGEDLQHEGLSELASLDGVGGACKGDGNDREVSLGYRRGGGLVPTKVALG
jgi:hypothetical protein